MNIILLFQSHLNFFFLNASIGILNNYEIEVLICLASILKLDKLKCFDLLLRLFLHDPLNILSPIKLNF